VRLSHLQNKYGRALCSVLQKGDGARAVGNEVGRAQ
jgi:hypothetical protein